MPNITLKNEATISIVNSFEEEEINISKTKQHMTECDESAYFQNILIELGRRLWLSTPTKQQYTKGCVWSPDGTCILIPVHLDGMHVIELPNDLYDLNKISNEVQRKVHSLNTAVHVKEGGTVYDYTWYPFMKSDVPETCCWLSTRQHEPIHMWDAFDGKLRCSYRGYNEVDEVETAISLCFSNDGEKIFSGYKKSIKIFDTSIPGRDYSTLSVKQAISCFALPGDNSQTITSGSWNGYVHHYDLRAPELGSLFTLNGHSGGITLLRYTPSTAGNWLLFSGARKDNKILEWDMRNYKKPLCEFDRLVDTNQRVSFDLSPQRNWLASGSTNGSLNIWNLLDINEKMTMPLHNDCCNGVDFHPTKPILATSSGQYHFIDVTQDDELNTQCSTKTEKLVEYENSLLLLWCGRNIQK